MTRFAEGGAASVVGGRSSERRQSPDVIVSEDCERRGRDLLARSGSTSRSRSTEERSRSRSWSRTPSPLFSPTSPELSGRLPLPASGTASSESPSPSQSPSRSSSPTQTTSSVLLCPPERGRSRTPTERGRATSRGSGSGSERSGSRNGQTCSPMGSLSPDGTSLGSAAYAQARGRVRRRVVIPGEQGLGESLSRNERRKGSGDVVREENQVESSLSVLGGEDTERERSTSPLSGSSTASNPSAMVSPSARTSQDDILPPKPRPTVVISATALDVWEEEETQRSRQPTPANSPTTVKPLIHIPQGALPLQENWTGREVAVVRDENESLIERAVDIVLTAGTLFRSIW